MTIEVQHMEDNGESIPVRKMTRAEAGRLGGKRGGRAKVKKGFAVNKELARVTGSIGGKKAAENRRNK